MPQPIIQKALQNLADEWPKLAAGLVVPAFQYGWTQFNERKNDNLRERLRARITRLAAFLETKLGDTPQALIVRAQAFDEYNDAVAELARLSEPKSSPAVYSARSRLQRWFLFYAPSSRWAWIPHSLYFIAVVFWLLGMVGILSDGFDTDDGLAALIGFGLTFLAIVLLLRWWAVTADSRQSSRSATRALTVTMYVCLILNGFMILGLALGDDDTPSLNNLSDQLGGLIAGTVLLSGAAFLCWFLRRRNREIPARPAAPSPVPPDPEPQ